MITAPRPSPRVVRRLFSATSSGLGGGTTNTGAGMGIGMGAGMAMGTAWLLGAPLGA